MNSVFGSSASSCSSISETLTSKNSNGSHIGSQLSAIGNVVYLPLSAISSCKYIFASASSPARITPLIKKLNLAIFLARQPPLTLQLQDFLVLQVGATIAKLPAPNLFQIRKL